MLESAPNAPRYHIQRAYVAAMLDVLGRLLVAGSRVDRSIQRELGTFPEGCTLGFSVLGDEGLALRLVCRASQLAPAPKVAARPAIEIEFKHLAHAFAVLSLQESTPDAYARARLSTHGDVALTLRFVRCLDRMQAVMLPNALAARAFESPPALPLARRLWLSARITASVARGVFTRSKS